MQSTPCSFNVALKVTMKMLNTLLAALALAALIFPSAALALSNEQQTEFDRIMSLGMADLTSEARALLDDKYPDEDWAAYKFPQYVYTSDSVEFGYMIAVKHPDLLAKVPCYCFCDAMGHENLLHCFLKKSIFGKKFDPHAAECTICYGQAMLAFLWADLGAADETIQKGMDKKFERLLNQQRN